MGLSGYLKYKVCSIFILLGIIFLTTAKVFSKNQYPSDFNSEIKFKTYADPYKLMDISKIVRDKSVFNIQDHEVPTKGNFWVMFSLKNPYDHQLNYVVKTNQSGNKYLYNASNGRLLAQNGTFMPALSGLEFGDESNLRLNIKPKENLTLVLKVTDQFNPDPFTIEVVDANKENAKIAASETQAKILSGIWCSFVMFNILIFFMLRDKSYIYYILFIFGLGVWLCRLFIFKWLNITFLDYLTLYALNKIFIIWFSVAYLSFAINYFKTSKNFPRWHKLLIAIQFAYIFPIILVIKDYYKIYDFTNDTVINIICIINVVSVAALSIRSKIRGFASANYFIIAETPLVVCGLFLAIEWFLTSEIENSIGFLLFQYASVLQIMLFSLALGGRYKAQNTLLEQKIRENERLKTQKLTELKQLNEEKNRELAITVEVKTRELKESNKQLSQTLAVIDNQKNKLQLQAYELENINQTKDKILSIIGHDLKSPISSLKIMLDLVNDGDLSRSEFESLTKDLQAKVLHLNDTLTNMLQWALSQMKGISTEPKKFNIQPLIDEKIILMEQTAGLKQLHIIKQTNRDAFVFADENQVGIILQNLLSNAIKFTPMHGDIRINVTQDAKFTHISVQDDGIGMPKEKVEELLKTDRQRSHLGTQGEKGTGFGLNLCKEMVNRNKGTLNIKSMPGEGSCITFSVPSFEESNQYEIHHPKLQTS